MTTTEVIKSLKTSNDLEAEQLLLEFANYHVSIALVAASTVPLIEVPFILHEGKTTETKIKINVIDKISIQTCYTAK